MSLQAVFTKGLLCNLLFLGYCLIHAQTCEWPNASNVGLSNPVTLTSTGSVTLKTSGTPQKPYIFQNKNVTGQITVQASYITIRNCRVWGGLYGIHLRSGSNIIIEHCEIGKESPSRMKGINTAANNVTIRKNYLHDLGDGIALAGNNVVIEDNFITRLITVEDDHNDGIQMFGGSGYLIKHNRIELPNQQTSCIGQHGAIVSNLVIESNYLNGGTYTIYTREKDGPLTNVSILGNYFGRDYVYGLHSSDITVTSNCNRYADNGLPAFGLQNNCQQYTCTFPGSTRLGRPEGAVLTRRTGLSPGMDIYTRSGEAEMTVAFSFSAPTRAELGLHTIGGTHNAIIASRKYTEGSHSEALNTARLKTGVYIITLVTTAGERRQAFVLHK